MGTISSMHGTISAKPYDHDHANTINGKCDRDRAGMLHGSHEAGTLHGSREAGTLRGPGEVGGRRVSGNGESQISAAMAEVGNLISSLGSLSAQAQGLPLTPPTLPGLPQNTSYQPQPVNYAFGDDSN